MTTPPRQLTEIATRVDAALTDLFTTERRTWRSLDPALDEPLGDLEQFVATGGSGSGRPTVTGDGSWVAAILRRRRPRRRLRARAAARSRSSTTT
ncbi:MAG: hypothetical protein R2695_06025 [Acidimicrobiales bacterium]